MNWDDVDDIIFDGTKEQIDSVKCPECKSHLRLSYYPETMNVEIRCRGCGTVILEHGVAERPNFALVESEMAV